MMISIRLACNWFHASKEQRFVLKDCNSLRGLHAPSRSMLRIPQLKVFTRYVLPVLAVVLALQTNWLIAPHVSFLPPFLTFLAAIMVTAWYGGFPSALFGVALSAVVINYYFIPPLYDFRVKPADLGAMGFFALEAITMAYCIDYLRRNETSLRRANLDLELQVSSKHQELSDKEDKVRGLMYQLAVTEERERRQLAAELHDYLAQLLTLARMKIKQAQQQVFHQLWNPTDISRKRMICCASRWIMCGH